MEKSVGNSNKKVNFYTFNKDLPYKVDKVFRKYAYITFILVCVILTCLVCYFISYIEKIFANILSTLIMIILSVLSLIMFVDGICSIIKDAVQNKKEQKILKNCTLTDGKIEQYRCIEQIRHSRSFSNHYFSVVLKYSYYNTNLICRETFFEKSYKIEPPYYKEKNLIIAFNDSGSLILSDFSLNENDEKKFAEAYAKAKDEF